MDKIMMNKENAMREVDKYSEGYRKGYSDGYDKALEAAREVAKKYLMPEETLEQELKPAIRFLGQSKKQLLDKVVEECQEVIDAFNDGEPRERIAEELADVQLACETAMSKLGYHEKERRSMRLRCIEKNSKRNYYMPLKEKYGN